MATRKSAKPAPTNPAGTAKGKTATTRKPRADWQAIERDYRTGRFTDQELADKHGSIVTRQAISKKAREQGWTKDLSREVRQATKASVIRAQVAEAVAADVAADVAQSCADATSSTTNAVLAAAELNKQVILSHRKSLKSAQEVAGELLLELSEQRLLLEHKELLAQVLAGAGAEPVDVALAQSAIQRTLALGNRGKTFKAITDAIVNLQNAERVAFGLDEKDDDPDKDSVSQALADFFGGIHGAGAGRLSFAPAKKA